MKRKNSILSLLLVLTIVVSAFAALPMTASAETTYPGGTLLYESFEGIASANLTPQPTGTTITTNGRTEGNDSGAGLGYYGKQDNAKGKHFNATLPASYLKGAEATLVEAQGPNAKLTLEFDFKYEGVVPTTASTLAAVLLGNDSLAGNGKTDGRANSAVAVYLQSPNSITVYNKAGSATKCYLPEGISFDEWHRYQLTVNLTNASSAGVKTYAVTVDGKYILDDTSEEITGLTSQLSATEITKLRIDTPNQHTTGLDNISVYKTTESNAALSTGALMLKLNEVNAKMAGYSAAAAGTSQLEAFETVVTAAGTMVTTAFGTYDASGAVVTAAKTQADVDAALANLTEAQEALEAHLAGITYPGGVLMYESFTGIVDFAEKIDYAVPSYQPKDTTATIYRKKAGTDSGAGLGDYAMQHKDNSSTNFTATIPTAYLGAHTDASVVAAQGPDAQLTLEFDFKFDDEVPTEAKTLTAVSIGNTSVAANGTGRENAAVAIYLQSPDVVRIYRAKSSYDDYYLPTGITFDQWHRYQLAVDLTDANSEGASTYTFTVDGKNLVDEEGAEQASFTKKLSATEITKLCIDTTNAYATRLDNVSVYKTNADNEALSTGALMTKLHEVNAKMALYSAAAEGTSQLEAFEEAVAAAGNMVTTAYGTYDAEGAVATTAKTQADVDAVLASLISAETPLKAVLPYYVIYGHKIDENDNITSVTVEEITAYTGSPIKLIVATFDTDTLSEVSMQDFTGADEYVLTTPLNVTDKSAAVFVWEMNDLIPLANIYYFGKVVDQD